MTPNSFNFKYLLELMYGAKLASMKASDIKDPVAFRNKFIELVQKDIRGQIENTLPIIYLVKPHEIVINLLSGLINKNLTEGDQDIGKTFFASVVNPNNGELLTPEDPFFSDALHSILVEMSKSSNVNIMAQEVFSSIESKMLKGKDITFKQLGDKAKKLIEIVNQAQPDINVICSIGTVSDVRKIEDLLTNNIQKAGNEMRSWLRENTPALLADADSFLNNFDSSKDLVFISSNFKKAREEIVNANAAEALVPIFASFGINAKPSFGVGKFTAAGHTGVISGRGTALQQVVGINSPLIQQTLYWANTQAKAPPVSLDPFVLETDHLNLSLDIKEGAIGTAKDLLYLNFSFVISQEASWNSSIGTSQEVPAMDRIVEKAWAVKRESLGAFFKTYIQKYVPDIVEKAHASPPLNQRVFNYLVDSIKGTNKNIAGKVIPTIKDSARKTTKASKAPASKNAKPAKANLPKTGGSKGIPSYTPQSVAPSITNLRELINSQLQDVISANMGNGSSRSVLNYRTGRLASSARVESLSVSRQGMITAFYTYMKNPYATFSDGGKQSSPKSRDPKLLISKSIREIAQQMAIDKLRAVSV
jgi:hypothetical protein